MDLTRQLGPYRKFSNEPRLSNVVMHAIRHLDTNFTGECFYMV